jgi:hypothetical protein
MPLALLRSAMNPESNHPLHMRSKDDQQQKPTYLLATSAAEAIYLIDEHFRETQESPS